MTSTTEKYYTSVDLQFYIGDICLDEAFSVEYSMSSPKYPVQGYHSRRVQAWADGVEICQGALEMNFKYRNELSMALDSTIWKNTTTFPPTDNEKLIRSNLKSLGRVIQWSYENVDGNIVEMHPLDTIEIDTIVYAWHVRSNDPDTKKAVEDALIALGIPLKEIIKFERDVVGSPIDPDNQKAWRCPLLSDFITTYVSYFTKLSMQNYNTTLAMSNPQQMKNAFWKLKPSSKFPVPFDSRFTSLKNDLEIWFLMSIEQVGDQLIYGPKEKIIIRDIHFTGEAIRTGMQERDYIRVMYPFVASHVE
jgi:hypothetical protein